MYEHTYWNRNGEAQAKYDAMEAAGFQYAKATHTLFHAYYRYHNDGDLPGWARSRWDITRYTFEFGSRQRVLTEAGEAEFERRITEGSKSSTPASCGRTPRPDTATKSRRNTP